MTSRGQRFALLGPLEVEVGGTPVTVTGPRRRALLVRLVAAYGEAVSAERLIGDLWDEKPPAAAAHTLQSHISSLRSSLAPGGLAFDGGCYQLHADAIDAITATELLASARGDVARGDPVRAAAALAGALSSWRGRPLEDAGDSVWATAERGRLQELRLIVLEEMFDAQLLAGDAADVAVRAEAAVAADPLREKLWRSLIIALSRCGRRAEALRAFQRLRRHLADELGVAPSDELVELDRAIARDDPTASNGTSSASFSSRGAAAAIPGVLRARASAPLVGRSAELDHLAECLRPQGKATLTVVTGPAGIGKSTLVAHAVAGRPNVVAAVCPPEIGEPLAPWADMLRQLGVRFADVAGDRDRAAEGKGDTFPADWHADPNSRAEARLQSVEQAMRAAANVRPLVAVIEDVQWADSPTLGCLMRLVGLEADLMIVATMRDAVPGQTSRRAEWFRALAGADDAGRVTEIELGGLDEDSTADLVALLADPSARSQIDVSDVHRGAGGNPLWVTEFLRSAATQRGTAPRNVADLIAKRLVGSREDVAAVLNAAAVLGATFDIASVVELLGRSDDHVMDQLERAERDGLVAEIDPDVFTFSHSLVHDSVLSAMLRSRVQRLNARAAELTNRSVFERARHWRDGGRATDQPAMIRAFLRAGEEALHVGDYANAATWIDEVVALSAGTDSDDHTRITVAIARDRLGFLKAEAGAVDRLIDLGFEARHLGFDDLVVRSALAARRGGPSNFREPDPRYGELVAAALALTDRNDTRTYAHLAGDLAAELNGWPQRAEATRLADEAIAAARESGDPTTLAYVVSTGATIGLPQRFGTLTATLAHLAAEVDHDTSANVLREQHFDAFRRGDAPAQRHYAERLRDEFGGTSPGLDWVNALILARQVQVADGPDAAEIAATAAWTAGSMAGIADADPIYASHYWSIRWQQRRLTEIMPMTEAAFALFPTGNFAAWLAVSHVEAGAIDAAAALLHTSADADFDDVGWSLLWLQTLALWGTVAAAAGDEPIAMRIVEALTPYGEYIIDGGMGVYGAAADFIGETLAPFAPERAVVAYEQALGIHERFEAPWYVANTRAALARIEAST